MSKKDALEDRLGAVLGRFGVVLGAVLEPWKRSRHYCRCFVKIHGFDVFEKIRCQEATWCRTWANLGTQKAPKGSPRGSQNGAKKEKKSEVKLREV